MPPRLEVPLSGSESSGVGTVLRQTGFPLPAGKEHLAASAPLQDRGFTEHVVPALAVEHHTVLESCGGWAVNPRPQAPVFGWADRQHVQ